MPILAMANETRRKFHQDNAKGLPNLVWIPGAIDGCSKVEQEDINRSFDARPSQEQSSIE